MTRWDVTALSRVCCPQIQPGVAPSPGARGPRYFGKRDGHGKITSDHTVDLTPGAQLLLLRIK